MAETLYERLGGGEGLEKIANDLIDLHAANPIVKARFVNSDLDKLKKLAKDFFGAGIGGPETYTGKDMVSAHTGMNINERELIAIIDDAMEALDKNGVGQQEKDEVLAILYSMKSEILHL